MKKRILKPLNLLLIILAMGFATTSSANTILENKLDSNEIIIAFEKLSSKQFLELDEAIAQIPGVTNFGYCQRINIYYFTYDENIYKTEDQVVEAITKHTKKYQPLLKIGTSAEQLSNNCNN
jgi:hypothetical protein